MTSSPPIASICIRANWSMPGVMNRYIKYEMAGDQYVGRCVSGKKRTSKDFALSNPYWDFSDMSKEEKELAVEELNQWIRARMPGDVTENDKVFAMLNIYWPHLFSTRTQVGWKPTLTPPVLYVALPSGAKTSRIRTAFALRTRGHPPRTLRKSQDSLLTSFTWRRSRLFGRRWRS